MKNIVLLLTAVLFFITACNEAPKSAKSEIISNKVSDEVLDEAVRKQREISEKVRQFNRLSIEGTVAFNMKMIQEIPNNEKYQNVNNSYFRMLESKNMYLDRLQDFYEQSLLAVHKAQSNEQLTSQLNKNVQQLEKVRIEFESAFIEYNEQLKNVGIELPGVNDLIDKATEKQPEQ